MKNKPRSKKTNEDWTITPEQIDQYVINRKEALKIAKEINQKIDIGRFTVKGRSRIIFVQHGDGSKLEFHSACFSKLSDDFMAVFTEHHGYHIYHVDDIDYIKEWLNPINLYFNNCL